MHLPYSFDFLIFFFLFIIFHVFSRHRKHIFTNVLHDDHCENQRNPFASLVSEVLFIAFTHTHILWRFSSFQISALSVDFTARSLRTIFKRPHVYISFSEGAISRRTLRGRGLFVRMTDRVSRLKLINITANAAVCVEWDALQYQAFFFFRKLWELYTWNSAVN